MRRLVAILLVAVGLAACSEPELTGFVREPTPSVASASLPEITGDGSRFEFRADDREVLLVYFGYTHCPDVCPTTLADTRTALSQLGSRAERVDFAMATIDPERDTEEILTGYVQSFLPDGAVLRTTDETELEEAVSAFGGSFSIDPDVDGEYVVSHTGSLYAVDDAGNLLVTWPFGVTIDDLANDLEILVERA